MYFPPYTLRTTSGFFSHKAAFRHNDHHNQSMTGEKKEDNSRMQSKPYINHYYASEIITLFSCNCSHQLLCTSHLFCKLTSTNENKIQMTLW